MSTAQYKQIIALLFINHSRINIHLEQRWKSTCYNVQPLGLLRASDLFGSRMYLKVAVRRYQARVTPTTSPTAQFSNTLMCEISADRQLPGSEQINTISPGAFFQSKREQSLLLWEVREETSLQRKAESVSQSFSCWFTWNDSGLNLFHYTVVTFTFFLHDLIWQTVTEWNCVL